MKAKLIITGLLLLLLLILSGCATGGSASLGYRYPHGGPYYDSRGYHYWDPEFGYYGYLYGPYGSYYGPDYYYRYNYPRGFYIPVPRHKRYRDRDDGNTGNYSGKHYLNRDGHNKGREFDRKSSGNMNAETKRNGVRRGNGRR